MTEIKPYMCSCCNDIWSRENQKNIKLGKYELHLCPDCYHEYIISSNKVLDKIRAEIEHLPTTLIDVQRPHSVVERDVVELGSVIRIIDKYKAESEK